MEEFRNTAPAIRDFEPQSIFPEQTITPYPGITIHSVDGGSLPVNKLTIAWQYGDANATTVSELCAARLAPMLMTEGTSTHTGAEIAEMIDFRGAFLSAGSSSQFSQLTLLSLNESTPALIPILTDILTNPAIPEQTFDNLRQTQAMQLQLKRQNVGIMAAATATSLSAGIAHPYSRMILPEEMLSTSRQDVIKAARDGIRTMPVHIFVGGALSTELRQAIEQLASNINEIRSAEAIPPEPVKYAPEAPQQVRVDIAGAVQSGVSLTLPIEISRADSNYIPLRLAVMALGGYFGSRLMQNVRERLGLTYGIGASLMGSPEGTMMAVNAQCDATSTERVIEEVKNEMRRMAETLMDGDELHRLRSFAATQLAATVGSAPAVIDHYYSNLSIGAPATYYADQWRVLGRLTAEQLGDMAKTYFDIDSLRIAVAGSPL